MSPTSGQPFVRLAAVSKAYGSGSSRLEVLDQVELDLQQQVELRDDGCVIARDLHGGEVHLRLTVTRPLTPDDLQ